MYCGLLQVELLNQSSFPFKFSSRNFICNSIGMTKLFKYALIILVAFQQDFNNYKYIYWPSADNDTKEVGWPSISHADQFSGFFRLCRHLNVKTQRAEKVRWLVDKQNAEMPGKVNACIFRVDNNQSVTCLTNNNDLSPPIETSVNIIMNCKCRL